MPQSAAADWLARIAGYSLDGFDAILDEDARCANATSSRMFARSLVAENRRRLLDELDRAR